MNVIFEYDSNKSRKNKESHGIVISVISCHKADQRWQREHKQRIYEAQKKD